MQQREFGRLGPVSILTLGGGGLGMLWGPTNFEECVATVHDAVAAGVNLLDLAPRYGDGKAEEVVGEAFAGRLPAGVRVTSKCNLGEQPPGEIDGILRRSIEGSLKRLRLSRLDLFFLHSNVVPDADHVASRPGAAGFRRLAAELGEDPAVLAHRYALALDIDTLVLGVKNRRELAACVAAAEAGPLGPELMARIDRSVTGSLLPGG